MRVVVPAKSLGDVKQRLAPALPASARRRLFAAMLSDVLDAVRAVPEAGGALVVTRDAEVAALASARGAEILNQDEDMGHTAAVMAGAAALVGRDCQTMLTIPGDVPLATPGEIRRIITAHDPSAPAMTIVPSHDRKGSNAVMLTPPNAVPLAFGDNSFGPHLERARALGVVPQVMELPGLARDVDTPDDLAAVIRARPGGATAEALEALGLVDARAAAKS